MKNLHLGTMEEKFADILWENVPIKSGELVKICEEELNWKKSTTYTVLRRFCECGIFKNESGKIQAVLTKPEFGALQGKSVIEKNFDGSISEFTAYLTKQMSFDEKDIREAKRILNSFLKK